MEMDIECSHTDHPTERMNQDSGSKETHSVDLKTRSKASVHVLKTLNAMRANEELCDLEFEVSSARFSVHRVVMAAWSPVLKNLLQNQAGCRQCVQVMYDRPEVFQHFITFLYTGIFEDEVSSIPAFLLLASTFQIHPLIELCEECLKSNTTVNNVISFYHQAVKFRLPDLELYCVDFLKQHLPQVTKGQELRELSPLQLNTFLGSEHMSKLNPIVKINLIMSWLTYDVPIRQQYLILLLKHIDWSVVANDFLQEISRTENVFISNPSSLYLLLQTLDFSSIPLGPYEDQFPGLREQYNHLLGSVVSSSIALGIRQPRLFKPVSFSLISRSDDDSTAKRHKDSVQGHESELKTCQTSQTCSEREEESGRESLQEDVECGGISFSWSTSEEKLPDVKSKNGIPENLPEELNSESAFDNMCTKQDAGSHCKCLVCHRTFDTYENFKVHELTHFRSNCHVCEICFQNFTSKEALERHYTQHEESKTQSDQEIERPKSQTKHLLLQVRRSDSASASENSQVCIACSKIFSSEKEMKKHLAASQRCRSLLAEGKSQNSDLSAEKAESRAVNSNIKSKSAELLHQRALDQVSSGKQIECIFCHQEFTQAKEKILHISSSPACRGMMKYILDQKFYMFSQEDKEACQEQVTAPSTCEFCQETISDKMSHLLTTACLYSLEAAVARHRASPSQTEENPGLTEEKPNMAEDSEGESSHKSRGEKVDNVLANTLPMVESTCSSYTRTVSTSALLKVRLTKVHGYDQSRTQMQEKSNLNAPNDDDFYCLSCRKYVKSEAEIKHHKTLSTHRLLSRSTMVKADWRCGYYRCKICDIKYDAKPPLFMHMRSHEPPSVLHKVVAKRVKDVPHEQTRCALCKKIVFKNGRWKHFDAHINHLVRTIQEKSDKPMEAVSEETCAICKQVFLSRKKHRLHLLRHKYMDIYGAGQKAKVIGKCRICNNSVKSKIAFQSHISNFHHKKMTFASMYQQYFIPLKMLMAKSPTLSKTAKQNDGRRSGKNSEKKKMLFKTSEEEKNNSDKGTFEGSDTYLHMQTKVVSRMDDSGTTYINDEGMSSKPEKSSPTQSDTLDSVVGRPECTPGFSLNRTKCAKLNCHICQVSIAASNYKKHLLTDHHWHPEKLHICQFCQLPFPFTKLLVDHKAQCKKDCRCDICGKHNPNVKGLRDHIILTHKADWFSYRSTHKVPSTQVSEVDNSARKMSCSYPSEESDEDKYN